jgi:sulfate adenylyltransferase subunit 1
MDLVGYDETVYTQVAEAVTNVATELGLGHAVAIPVSALEGDNVVTRTTRAPWYTGPSLLELLEELPPAHDPATESFRFPVQLTIRPQDAARDPAYREYRGYAGQIAAGVVRRGDRVTVLPLGRTTTVAGIDTADGELEEAFAPMSVTLRLADEMDIARGDLIAAADAAPEPIQDVDGMVAWLHEQPLREGRKVLLKHTTRSVPAIVRDISGKLDLDTMSPEAASSLELNDIGRISLRLASPIMPDEYLVSRRTGPFLLVDPQSGATLAAGMVRGDKAFSAQATIGVGQFWAWEI